jgi:hypothetical protein
LNPLQSAEVIAEYAEETFGYKAFSFARSAFYINLTALKPKNSTKATAEAAPNIKK